MPLFRAAAAVLLLRMRGGAASVASQAHGIQRAARRSNSTSTLGVAFDIDGVIKQGGRYCLEAAWALCRLEKEGIPYVFLTNGGGGNTEEQYAAEMNKKLSGPLDSCSCSPRGAEARAAALKVPPIVREQMILSYSLFPELEQHKGETVLVVGHPADKVKHAAREMGFAHAVHLEDYVARHPELDPFRTDKGAQSLPADQWEEFGAVLVVSDPGPQFWPALQAVSDVLCSANPMRAELDAAQVPIYFSNRDLLWRDVFARSRFGQGAYLHTLKLLYMQRLEALGLSEAEVEERMRGKWHAYGKPAVEQQQLAQRRIDGIAARRGLGRVERYFMVGDNPRSDMMGAHNARRAGLPWQGILVRTGVYADGDDTAHAAEVVDSVAEATEHILRQRRDAAAPARP